MTARRPTEADAPAVVELIRAVETAMTGVPEESDHELREHWSRIELDESAWLIELDGRLAGYAALYTDAQPRCDGYVHPGYRGRGIGGQLVELVETEAHARTIRKLEVPVYGADNRAQELLRSRGYDEVRHYYRMAIELDAPPPPVQFAPEFSVAPVDPTEITRFHEALDEAFAEEWGHETELGIDWASIRERRHPDHSLWFAVKDGDQIAATAITSQDRGGVGWIAAIGVREPWRRRGLGQELLLHCFGELYARGQHKVALGVDAENPTGATRLYERAGMHVAYNFVCFEKTL
jgi:mycothiol synthase